MRARGPRSSSTPREHPGCYLTTRAAVVSRRRRRDADAPVAPGAELRRASRERRVDDGRARLCPPGARPARAVRGCAGAGRFERDRPRHLPGGRQEVRASRRANQEPEPETSTASTHRDAESMARGYPELVLGRTSRRAFFRATR